MERGAGAVIFDMDGLLVDSEPLYKRAWQGAAAELGFDLGEADYATLLGRAEAECESRLLDLYGRAFPLERFRELWKSAWRRFVEEGGLVAKPGAPDLLSALRRAGSPLAVATSSASGYARLSLERTGLASFFEHVVTADEVRRAKPAPDLFVEAAARLDVPAHRCLVLEDSPAGGEAALAAGMAVILVPDLQTPTRSLAARALGVFASLDEAAPLVLQTIGSGVRR